MKSIVALVMAGLMLSTSGCFALKATLPGALRNDVDADVVVIGSFDYEVTHFYLFEGLLLPPPASLFEVPLLKAVEAAGGDGVANIVLETRFSAADATLRWISFGLVAPRTYRMRADIVRINAPALAGTPLLSPSSRAGAADPNRSGATP